MPLPDTYLAYEREIELYDRALEAKRGLRVTYGSISAAQSFVARMHKARAVDRRRNTEVYQPGDPLFGCSIYDGIICRIRSDGDNVIVLLEKTNIPFDKVEEIDDDAA